jgi:hypothetical protein
MEEDEIWILRDKLMVLQAVQLLEHHDRNWLRPSNKGISEDKIKLVAEIMDNLMEYGGVKVTTGHPLFRGN